MDFRLDLTQAKPLHFSRMCNVYQYTHYTFYLHTRIFVDFIEQPRNSNGPKTPKPFVKKFEFHVTFPQFFLTHKRSSSFPVNRTKIDTNWEQMFRYPRNRCYMYTFHVSLWARGVFLLNSLFFVRFSIDVKSIKIAYHQMKIRAFWQHVCRACFRLNVLNRNRRNKNCRKVEKKRLTCCTTWLFIFSDKRFATSLTSCARFGTTTPLPLNSNAPLSPLRAPLSLPNASLNSSNPLSNCFHAISDAVRLSKRASTL